MLLSFPFPFPFPFPSPSYMRRRYISTTTSNPNPNPNPTLTRLREEEVPVPAVLPARHVVLQPPRSPQTRHATQHHGQRFHHPGRQISSHLPKRRTTAADSAAAADTGCPAGCGRDKDEASDAHVHQRQPEVTCLPEASGKVPGVIDGQDRRADQHL